MVKIVIVGNARRENLAHWSKVTDECDLVIACDGAIENCLSSGIKVDVLIGDMDSIDAPTLEYAKQNSIEVIQIPDQGNNDLRKALSHAKTLQPNVIDIIGVDGGKSDHQFANYMSLIEAPVEARILLDDCVVFCVKSSSSVTYSIEVNQEFSLFSVGQSTGVTLAGGKWELNNATLQPGSYGLHNIAISDHITVSCETGSLLVFVNR